METTGTGNTARWTLLGLLLAVNVVSNIVLKGSWLELPVSIVSGLGVVAVIADHLVRGRRRRR
ncbi:hypothetical protein [Actinomadura verrucosospora]|uniref:Uncharacterized protein n=1 Tax=Actinomadura verrucosospora TaxID=46165 RepID=A0A7D3W6J9_ACTVE|nr:hypothetical protein [Actinomadura verrucosospora]QKG27512.1 hypothetical protein ACTIVE_9167 [Actinomadura verrucosospora]